MKRRDFLKKGVGAGIFAGTALSLVGHSGLIAGVHPEDYDLVAIKGGEAVDMFDKGIASLGGMRKFVKKNQTVVVKPNIGWDVVPEKGANTNPHLVKRIIEHCFNAGAKEVYVFDHTCDKWDKCYQNSGIEKAAKEAGAKVVPGNSESHYQEVEINGKKLKTDKVHELILDSDVFINVPVLKSHSSAKITVCLKNLMGINWDRRFWHKNDLHQCIADFASYRKPDLNIVDAYRVMTNNGPRGVSIEDISVMKSQIISTDMVAADAAATKIFGLEPADIGYIQHAADNNIGEMDLTKLNIKRIMI
ncbi:DUF362 domain-containing protein [Bacteroidota bacterium]